MKKSQFKVGDRVRVVDDHYPKETLRKWNLWPDFVIADIEDDLAVEASGYVILTKHLKHCGWEVFYKSIC